MTDTRKPFDLEAALAGAKVETRDGRPVTQLTRFAGAEDSYRLAGVVGGGIETWTEAGEFIIGGCYGTDLVMFRTKREAWINLYPDGRGDWFKSKQDADVCAACYTGRLCPAIRVEWDE